MPTACKHSIWWPGISHIVDNTVKLCPACTRDSTPQKNHWSTWVSAAENQYKLLQRSHITRSWLRSIYTEIQKLSGTTLHIIIKAFKMISSQFGVPDVVVSDLSWHTCSRQQTVLGKLYSKNSRDSSHTSWYTVTAVLTIVTHWVKHIPHFQKLR